jgi:hypothetical protein
VLLDIEVLVSISFMKVISTSTPQQGHGWMGVYFIKFGLTLGSKD